MTSEEELQGWKNAFANMQERGDKYLVELTLEKEKNKVLNQKLDDLIETCDKVQLEVLESVKKIEDHYRNGGRFLSDKEYDKICTMIEMLKKK